MCLSGATARGRPGWEGALLCTPTLRSGGIGGTPRPQPTSPPPRPCLLPMPHWQGPPLLPGDHQDVIEQEQVACWPAGEFSEKPGFFCHRKLPTLQQPAGGRDQREGLRGDKPRRALSPGAQDVQPASEVTWGCTDGRSMAQLQTKRPSVGGRCSVPGSARRPSQAHPASDQAQGLAGPPERCSELGAKAARRRPPHEPHTRQGSSAALMHSLGEGLPTLRATSVQGPFLQRGSLPAAAWEAGLAKAQRDRRHRRPGPCPAVRTLHGHGRRTPGLGLALRPSWPPTQTQLMLGGAGKEWAVGRQGAREGGRRACPLASAPQTCPQHPTPLGPERPMPPALASTVAVGLLSRPHACFRTSYKVPQG